MQKPGQEVEVIHAGQDIKSTQTTIPFFKSNNLDYADFVSFMGKHAQTAGWVLFVIITIFVVTAVSNGANLNDGMDGMAAGNSAIIGLALGILAYVSSHIEYAGYLNIMYIPRIGRTGNLHLRLHWCLDWFSVVQCVSGTGIHG